MNLQKSKLALIIASALSTVAISTANAGNGQFERISSYQSNPSKVSSASGMANQIDGKSGNTTFYWAAKNEVKAPVFALANDNQVVAAADYYLNNLQGVSTQSNATGLKAYSQYAHTSKKGVSVVKYKQEMMGVEVFNKEYSILMDAELNLVAASGQLQKGSNNSQPLGKFSTSESVIKTAFNALGGNADSLSLAKSVTKGQYETFNAVAKGDKVLVGEPRVKQVYFDQKGRLIAAHYVEVEVAKADSVDSELFSFVISGETQEVLFQHSLMAHSADFTYRVYADDGDAHYPNKPWDSPHGNVIPATPGEADPTAYLDAPLQTLAHGPISTMDPWLPEDATMTVGYNVIAYADVIAPDGPSAGDFYAETTGDKTFDFPYMDDQAETSMANRKAAIVNLFYLNNYLHDVYYDHGFDEASGNAQAMNYGRGGEEGDAMHVQVQDNSGFNNANMSTPADGFPPRMQMYLWDSKDAVNGVDYGTVVTSDEAIGLLESTRVASFGPGQYNISGDLVAYDDGVDVGSDGCDATVFDVAGKIAVIDRGACAFTQKVLNAQANGAVGVIIVNNNDDGTPAPMGGTDPMVTIPSIGLNYAEGHELYDAMGAGPVSVNIFNNKKFKASSWDNGIVAHEWGHYIQNRLVGNASGLINNQGRAMGEGWSDFHALLLLAGPEDVDIAGNDMYQLPYSATSYVAPFNQGIRLYPYTTDMEINPHTFGDIANNAQVHASGTVWATMLWDAYVGMINAEHYNFDEAKSQMMEYLVASYKLTPIAPTYTEARDALLAVAYATNIDDYQIMVEAFARRGMGFGAISPPRYSTDHLGVEESFETEQLAGALASHEINADYEGLTAGFCSRDGVVDNGETATLAFTINNAGSDVLTGLTGQVTVTSGHDVTLANEGMVTFGDIPMFGKGTSAPLEFVVNDAMTADNVAFELTFPDLDESVMLQNSTYSFATSVHFDKAVKELDGLSTFTDFNHAATSYDLTEKVMLGGDMAVGTGSIDDTFAWYFGSQYFYIENNGFPSDTSYETKTMTVGYGGDFVVSWFQYFDIEQGWDGGVVEISVNGSDWVDVTEMGGQFDYGYTGELEDLLPGRSTFTGFDAGMESINFGTGLNGSEVKLRFRMVTDYAANALGWIIDDLSVSNVTTPIFHDLVAGDTYDCENRLPHLTLTSDAGEVVDNVLQLEGKEGTSVTVSATAIDANADDLTYMWEQVSGSAATIEGADMAEATITLPSISSDEVIELMLTVSDGTGSVSSMVSIDVEADPEPVTPPPTSSSSSGSFGFMSLLLLPLALLRRRK